MNRFSRLCKHLFTTDGAGRRIFPAATLAEIEKAIAAGEQTHRAEIGCIIEPSLSMDEVWSGMSARQRAIELFSLHRIWDTEENCGVLVYINLADHKVEIIADRSIERLVQKERWHAICHTMTHAFARGHYHDGVLAALEQINGLLAEHFPATGERPNQLSNRPVIL